MIGGRATWWRHLPAATSILAAGSGPLSAEEPAAEFSEAELRRIYQHSPLPPVPPDPTNAVADDERAARFGQALFFETRFSSNEQIGCVSCHDPSRFFTDAKPLGEGMGKVARHTPALWNLAYNRWYFWDGRADSLWAQALEPLENPLEIGGTRLGVMRLIHDDPTLSAAYEALFGELPPLRDEARFPPSARPVPDDPEHPHHRAWLSMSPTDQEVVSRAYSNIGKALAAYERRMVSRRAPFDVFVEGLREDDAEKIAALSPSAQRGLKLFIGKGQCRLCHSGPNFTDGEFHSIRVAPRDGGPPRDAGRYEGIQRIRANPFNALSPFSDQRSGPPAEKIEFLASNPETWGTFKTPSLRNVAVTPPYMHQGQFATLKDVIHFYSTQQGAIPPGHHDQEQILIPLNLKPEEAGDLIAFLESLTDTTLPADLLGQPRVTSDPPRPTPAAGQGMP